MKKIILSFLLTMIIVPFTYVNAASNNVLTLTVSKANGTISYSGTTDNGVIAVSCGLYDSNNNEIDFKSSSVSNNTFNDTFTETTGAYLVKCANYNGGDYITKNLPLVTNDINTNTDPSINSEQINKVTNTSNPQTGDNVIFYIGVLILSLIGLIIGTFYIRKNKLIKNR